MCGVVSSVAVNTTSSRSRLDVRKQFFTQRVVNLWNALPVNLVSAPTVNAFKNRLDKLWKDQSRAGVLCT